MSRAAWGVVVVFGLAGVGCSVEETLVVTPDERGRAWFYSTRISRNRLNVYTCATCHDTDVENRRRFLPGGTLAGVSRRPTYWGGVERDLLTSVNHCLHAFMLDPTGLARTQIEARELVLYLTTLEGPAEPVPFTVVADVLDVPRGDATVGKRIYEDACARCHGEMHTGLRALARTPRLPEDNRANHALYTEAQLRLQVIEKVRHGPFFGYGGTMPPFSREALSDADLGHVLEALGFRGQ